MARCYTVRLFDQLSVATVSDFQRIVETNRSLTRGQLEGCAGCGFPAPS